MLFSPGFWVLAVYLLAWRWLRWQVTSPFKLRSIYREFDAWTAAVAVVVWCASLSLLVGWAVLSVLMANAES